MEPLNLMRIVHEGDRVTILISSNGGEVWRKVAFVTVGQIDRVILDSECTWIETPTAIHISARHE